MENQLTVIEKKSISEMMEIGKLFAESGMFVDAKQQSQAFVKILAGSEIGIPAFAAMSGIHIIQGKPTIGAGLIAARVKGSGKYDYKVTEQTEKICSIDFYQGKDKIGTSTFTIEDAKKAGTKNLDKFPKNMLFARAISNGVKWYTPDVFSGPVYVPEEMEQTTIDTPHTEVSQGPAPVVAVPMTPQPVIDNHVHAVNAIKKHNESLASIKEQWDRMDKPTQSHPAVIDEMAANMVAFIKAAANMSTLKSVWATINNIDKSFILMPSLIEVKEARKIELTPVKA